jgi:hypothetical protein
MRHPVYYIPNLATLKTSYFCPSFRKPTVNFYIYNLSLLASPNREAKSTPMPNALIYNNFCEQHNVIRNFYSIVVNFYRLSNLFPRMLKEFPTFKP